MSVGTYSLKKEGGRALSDHFRVREFASHDGADKILVDDRLIVLLEALRSKLNCRAITVNSGYRTPSHDRAVGGSGRGQHTKGLAADIVCTDRSGNTIKSALVACALEDLGAAGIGVINYSGAVHVDVADRRWWGDETRSTSLSIEKLPGGHSSFYDYFGIARGARPDGVFSRGSRGEGVKWIQRRLNEKGFSCGEADGVFGARTLAALKNFQKANSLAADGVAGPLTLAKLEV